MEAPEIFFFILTQLKQVYDAFLPYELRVLVWKFYHSPFPYLVTVIFFLEWLIPVQKDQQKISAGTWQDFVWYHLDHFFHVTVLLVYGEGIQRLVNQYFSFLAVPDVEAWPLAARIVFSFLLFDFMQWVHHYVRHKIKPLWIFHRVHHSQREMNLFTAQRVHLVEYFIRKPITFIPLYLFHANPFELAMMLVIVDWYPRLYHANIKSNFGILKYLLVTPQSHRIHHSLDPKHHDKNFGAYTTIWDRIFGTLYKNYEEYPDTGLEILDFPMEKKKGLSVLWNYWNQFLYPFRELMRSRGQKTAAAAVLS